LICINQKESGNICGCAVGTIMSRVNGAVHSIISGHGD